MMDCFVLGWGQAGGAGGEILPLPPPPLKYSSACQTGDSMPVEN